MCYGKGKMKIVLTQPNYAWFNKRARKIPPYTMAILNACLGEKYDVRLSDPNYSNMGEEEVFNFFREVQPEIVGVNVVT